MEQVYSHALKYKDERKFGEAKAIFEHLLSRTEDPEDQAYLQLHLYTCLNHLGMQEEAERVMAQAFSLAPPMSRFPLDAGMERATWETENGDFRSAVARYKGLLEDFGDLLAEPDETERLHFVKEQIAKLSSLIMAESGRTQ